MVEELKLLIPLLQQLGHGTQEAYYWFLGIGALKAIIEVVGWLCALWIVSRVVLGISKMVQQARLQGTRMQDILRRYRYTDEEGYMSHTQADALEKVLGENVFHY